MHQCVAAEAAVAATQQKLHSVALTSGDSQVLALSLFLSHIEGQISYLCLKSQARWCCQ